MLKHKISQLGLKINERVEHKDSAKFKCLDFLGFQKDGS